MGKKTRALIIISIFFVACTPPVPNGSDDNTPLMWASINGNYLRAKEAIELDANMNKKNKNGYTALMYASGAAINVSEQEQLIRGRINSSKENIPLLILLLKAGADPNTKNSNGESAIFLYGD